MMVPTYIISVRNKISQKPIKNIIKNKYIFLALSTPIFIKNNIPLSSYVYKKIQTTV